MDNFPMRFTSTVEKMLKDGVFYLCGRDKNFRPIVCINAHKIQSMNPQPETHDVITLSLFIFELLNEYLMDKGTIENLILLINCENLSIFSVPYAMMKAVMTTV